jgi:hypothetical protein
MTMSPTGRDPKFYRRNQPQINADDADQNKKSTEVFLLMPGELKAGSGHRNEGVRQTRS